MHESLSKPEQVGVDVSKFRASASFPSTFSYDTSTKLLTHVITVPEDNTATSVSLEIYAADKIANDWTERWTMTLPPRPEPTPLVCPAGQEVWNEQCVDVCEEDETRNPDTGICELPCSQDPLILPDALNPVVESAGQLLAPSQSGFATLALSPSQTGIPEGFKLFEAKFRQIQAFQLKIDSEQAKASPNQTKITLWNQQIQLKQQEVADIQVSMAQWVSALNAQRADFRGQLNSIQQDSSYSLDVYQSLSDPELPQTLEDYKSKIVQWQYAYKASVSNENTYDLLDASNVLAHEQELYVYLVQDYLAQKFDFGPEAPDEDPTDEDLEKQNTPKKLINYLARRIVNHSERLALQQQKINQIVSEGLQGLGINAQDYSKSYHDQLEQQLLNSIEQAENVLAELRTQLEADNGFSIQAAKQQKNALEQQIEKVQAAVNEAKNAVKAAGNAAWQATGDAAKATSKAITSSAQKVQNESAKLMIMAQNYGPEALAKVNQFYATIDPFFRWHPAYNFSAQFRNCVIFQTCASSAPSENDKNGKLLECAKNTLVKLKTLQDTTIDGTLQKELIALMKNIVDKKVNLEFAIKTGTQSKGAATALLGNVAEGMATVRLGQVTNTNPLLRVGFDVKKNGKTATDIDMITGTKLDIKYNQNSRVAAMYELKTGNDTSQYKSHAKEKFEFAAQHNAGRFIYWIDSIPGSRAFSNLMDTLPEIAEEAGYKKFNPNQDIQYIRDVLPDLRSCGW